MNLKLALLLIGTIFLMMLAGGGASAYIGYLMGREALKVVTQPDTNSEQLLGEQKIPGGSHKGLKIITEREILVNVYNHVESQKNSGNFAEQSLNYSFDESNKVNAASNSIKSVVFPLRDRSGGVTLEVSQAQLEGSSLTLNVNMKNEGSKPIRFLYSFLDVRDDKGRPLSAIPDGLPGELPANGANFSGKLRIPLTLLNKSQNISVILTNYPEQDIELRLEGIPIAR